MFKSLLIILTLPLTVIAEDISLSELSSQSDLVAIAQPRRLALDNGVGDAIFKVVSIIKRDTTKIKNDLTNESIEIKWNVADKDLALEFLRTKTLLFLKKDPLSESYYATKYGYSFFPLLSTVQPVNGCAYIIPKSYPAEVIDFGDIKWQESQVYIPFLPSEVNPVKTLGICVQEIK